MTRSIVKRFFLTMVFLSGAALGVANAQTPSPTPAFINYTHKTLGFSLQVPSDWTIKEDMSIQGYTVPMLALGPLMYGDDLHENINVMPEEIGAVASAEDYLNKSRPEFTRSLSGFKEISTGKLTGGFPNAMYMIYTHPSPEGAPLKVIAFFYVQGHKGYPLTCTASAKNFDRFKDLFMAIGKSFTPPAAGAQTPTAPPQLTRYTHKTIGFSLLIPSDWTLNEDFAYQSYTIPLMAVGPFMYGDEFRENAGVFAEDLGSIASTEEYLNKSLPAMSKFMPDFKELSRGNLSGGFPNAMYMIYTHGGQDAPLKVIVFFYTQGGKGYTLTCTSSAKNFDHLKDLFTAIGKSFLPPAPAKP